MLDPIELETSNIPIINLRMEFDEYLNLLRSEPFKKSLFECFINPVKVSKMAWGGMPHDLLTLMLQRSILGLEAYVSAAVSFELPPESHLSEEIIASLNNPFRLNRKLVVAIYDKLPGLISDECKLSTYSQALFDALARLYESVRNPIFHGSQVNLSPETYSKVANCFELLAAVYSWIDTWYRALPNRYKGNRPLFDPI